MTTMEEDLLLSEATAAEYDHLTVIDEDLLLGAEDVLRKDTRESTDDCSILLNSVEQPSENEPENALETNIEQNDQNGEDNDGDENVSEKEELDYEEEEDDDDKRERTSRFTSEKKGGSRGDSDGADENKKENEENKATRTGIPSLFDKTITNNPMKSGEQPIGVVLRIEGEAERVFYPPPSFMECQQLPPIVPRLPNGIPLVGMPANHGRAGFGAGYQAQGRMSGGGGMVGMPMGWENQVNAFLNNTTQKLSSHGRGNRKRRSSSYSSSSSDSSDSRSRSRSRSSSRSDRRRKEERKRRREDRERRRDDRRDGRRDDKRDDRKRYDGRRYRESHYRDTEKETRYKKDQSRNSTIESAKALGLSNDYIDQVNEQKKKREEIVRKKEERRHAPVSEKKDLAPSTVASTSSTSSSKDKKKAYLAVNVCGVQKLPTAVKKIEAIAGELGPIKKCWRSADDVVSIIFNTHDKAKDFMIKYNGKVLTGLRITVSLEKKFLNLSEVN